MRSRPLFWTREGIFSGESLGGDCPRPAAIVATIASFAGAEACAPLPAHHSTAPPRISSRTAAARLIESALILPPAPRRRFSPKNQSAPPARLPRGTFPPLPVGSFRPKSGSWVHPFQFIQRPPIPRNRGQ